MLPRFSILGMDLYSILMTVGVIAAMLLIRVLSDKRGFSAKWQNFALLLTVGAVILGYGSSVLFQGLYNIETLGHFELTESTGATFYGGLIGGALVYILAYFGIGHFLFPDGYHVRRFRSLLSIAACSITAAHGFGRLGCLMAGCCYGRVYAEPQWFTFSFPLYNKAGEFLRYRYAVPVQLYEALFLFILSALLILLFLQKKSYGMSVYMLAYGLWRFVAEYLRDDYRGTTFVSFLTPSQLISVVLLIGALAVFLWERYMEKKSPQIGLDEADAAALAEAAAAARAEAEAEAGDAPEENPEDGTDEPAADAPDESAAVEAEDTAAEDTATDATAEATAEAPAEAPAESAEDGNA